MRGYRETMNLVTTGNVAISVSTCIVGLLLLAPRTEVRAAVRYTIMMMRRSDVEPVRVELSEPDVDLISATELEPVRELVDA